MLHIEVAPAAPAAATAQATARRMVSGVRPHYLPSGQVARRLRMSSRTLGKLTGQACLSQAPALSTQLSTLSSHCLLNDPHHSLLSTQRSTLST